MPTVSELRTCIEELSCSIHALQKQRSQLQGDLNLLLDPITQLPVEISSHIFRLCLPLRRRLPHSTLAPMLLLNICHSWSNIALSVHSLWTTVRVDGQYSAKTFEVWANRAQPLLLTLLLRGYFDQDVQALVIKHADWIQILDMDLTAAQQLAVIAAASLSSLKKLTIGSRSRSGKFDDDEDDSPQFFPEDECVDILRTFPALLECNFYNLLFEERDLELIPHLTHPSLQHLRLGRPRCHDLHDNYRSSATILNHLTLPALQTIVISDLDITWIDFSSFLARSSPPLLSLHMDALTYEDMDPLYRLVPSLTNLDLVCRRSADNLPFIASLATDLDLLPNLRALTIWGYFYNDEGYEDLVRLLTVRQQSHCPLQSLNFIFSFTENGLSDFAEPDADTILALQQLSGNGTYIHIGPQDENYI